MKHILKKIETEVEKRQLTSEKIKEILSSNESLKSRRIIGGYASVAIIDREGHRITISALKEAVKRHMDEVYYRPVNVFHSDVTIGRVLPKWTNPDTGEVVTTHVDDKGWYVVCEIRDDIELADKVWKEIEKGNIKSFSIAGSSKIKNQKYEDGRSFYDIEKLDIYETTLCLSETEKIWTSTGLKEIKNIKEGELVLTHLLNWKPVIRTMKRTVDEELIKITTEQGTLISTSEHPIRALVYGGQKTGTHYEWIEIGNLKEGNLISYHYPVAHCKYCNKPIFIEKEGLKNKTRKYCSKEFANNKLTKILKVEKIKYSGLVYNLEVQDDNSYTTEFAVVHNCETPVNQMSKFDMLWNPNKVEVHSF